MGLGQTLLTIMALMLMGRIILNMNSATYDTGITKDMAEYRITGTSLGTSTLERAIALDFDENTKDTDALTVTALSLTLGREGSTENTLKNGLLVDSLFDDMDDYNGYTRWDTLTNSAIYKTEVKVQYVSIIGNVIVDTSTARTFNKRVTVYVTSPFLLNYATNPPSADTLTFQTVRSYWFFR